MWEEGACPYGVALAAEGYVGSGFGEKSFTYREGIAGIWRSFFFVCSVLSSKEVGKEASDGRKGFCLPPPLPPCLGRLVVTNPNAGRS